MSDFEHFQVFVDEPTEDPVLGFDIYARALAEVVRNSTPRFAVGVFGQWGTGKSTLMKTIRKELKRDPSIVTVWFNAWRYEREEYLIVPLLDTIREHTDAWVDELRRQAEADAARKGALDQMIGVGERVSKALWKAGVQLAKAARFSAKLGVVDVELDVGAALENGQRSVSLYHDSYREMRTAFRSFKESVDKAAGGTDLRPRIVVFVDDLDRCLPEEALQVLESMKLFFDELGFVFVVGLDKEVIQRAIEFKYRGTTPSTANGEQVAEGSEYVKKIFQVPFALPTIAGADVTGYFDSLIQSHNVGQDQHDHFDQTVRAHLQFIPGGRVNPREVKRLLNAYTLQLKMLAPKLHGGLRPSIVLALQIMAFRDDWGHVYDELVRDPGLVQLALRNPNELYVGVGRKSVPIPLELRTYLDNHVSELATEDLAVYVTSAESIRSSDHGILELHQEVGRVYSLIASIDSGAAVFSEDLSKLQGIASRLLNELTSRTESMRIAGLRDRAREFERLVSALDAKAAEDERRRWGEQVAAIVDQIDADMNDLRRYAAMAN